MYKESFKLVERRLTEWNPGGFDQNDAQIEYGAYTSEVVRAFKSGNLIECLARICSDYSPGVTTEELLTDPELLLVHKDISLILSS